MTVIARGPAQLYDIQSMSGKSLTYRVVLGYESPDDDTCTCPAFFYRTQKAMGPDTPGCKHVRQLRAARMVEAPPALEVEPEAVDRAFIAGFNVAKDLAGKGLL